MGHPESMHSLALNEAAIVGWRPPPAPPPPPLSLRLPQCLVNPRQKMPSLLYLKLMTLQSFH